jgi:hypothetical protein
MDIVSLRARNTVRTPYTFSQERTSFEYRVIHPKNQYSDAGISHCVQNTYQKHQTDHIKRYMSVLKLSAELLRFVNSSVETVRFTYVLCTL